MAIPASIKSQKPSGFGALEIRQFGNSYYAYQIMSRWDPKTKTSRKVTGKSIGKITEKDGFVPNANGLRLMIASGAIPQVNPVVKNYGCFETMQQLSPRISQQLRLHFPEMFREIRALALLRLVDGITSAKMAMSSFQSSCLSDDAPDLAMSEISVRKFVQSLGERQDRIDRFMRDDILPNSHLLFDGTSIFSRSADSLSEVGYNPDHSLNPQTRILYIFDKGAKRPVFYRVLQGSVVDKSAFLDTVRDSGCKDCVIIADKGFYSKKNVSALQASGMKYILPLQENTKNVDPEFYANLDDHKFDGYFAYKKRLIWYAKRASGTKGNSIYTFRDDLRKMEKQVNFVEQVEADWGEEQHDRMEILDMNRSGYYSFCSNIDTESVNIFLDYKSRWDIENCFDYLKNSVSTTASYAHNDNSFRGWAFLNHISLLYYYGLVNALENSDYNGKLSANDLIRLTKNIYRIKSDSGTFCVSAIQKKTREILDALNVDLLR